MKAKLGLLNADKRWWLGIAENCRKTQESQGSVRQASGGDDKVALGKKNLYRATLNKNVEVVDPVVEVFQAGENRLFGDREVRFQSVQEQAEIREVLFQCIVPHVCFPRFAKHGVAPEHPFPVDANFLVVPRQPGQLGISLRVSPLGEDQEIGFDGVPGQPTVALNAVDLRFLPRPLERISNIEQGMSNVEGARQASPRV
jgi:hypothetical protein